MTTSGAAVDLHEPQHNDFEVLSSAMQEARSKSTVASESSSSAGTERGGRFEVVKSTTGDIVTDLGPARSLPGANNVLADKKPPAKNRRCIVALVVVAFALFAAAGAVAFI